MLCVALVLLKRISLEDESNTHLALGRGVRGEGVRTGGRGREGSVVPVWV
jgi:hypothetical protein